MTFTAKYGVVGLSVVQKEFIAEGINEAGLSAGLFFFPQYGGYEPYEPAQNDRTLADLQFVAWVLTSLRWKRRRSYTGASENRPDGRSCWKSSAECRIFTKMRSVCSPTPPVSSGSSPT